MMMEDEGTRPRFPRLRRQLALGSKHRLLSRVQSPPACAATFFRASKKQRKRKNKLRSLAGRKNTNDMKLSPHDKRLLIRVHAACRRAGGARAGKGVRTYVLALSLHDVAFLFFFCFRPVFCFVCNFAGSPGEKKKRDEDGDRDLGGGFMARSRCSSSSSSSKLFLKEKAFYTCRTKAGVQHKMHDAYFLAARAAARAQRRRCICGLIASDSPPPPTFPSGSRSPACVPRTTIRSVNKGAKRSLNRTRQKASDLSGN
jgi:hypothetical protein